jgi:hypothetical protein
MYTCTAGVIKCDVGAGLYMYTCTAGVIKCDVGAGLYIYTPAQLV